MYLRIGAQAISYLFHPLFILAYMMLLLNGANEYLFEKHEFPLLFARILQFTVFIPLAGVYLLKGLGFIDGIDIKDMNLQSLRGIMGLVTQDSILFNDTIKNNILLGKENATDEEIIEALKIANAYEFVIFKASIISSSDAFSLPNKILFLMVSLNKIES